MHLEQTLQYLQADAHDSTHASVTWNTGQKSQTQTARFDAQSFPLCFLNTGSSSTQRSSQPWPDSGWIWVLITAVWLRSIFTDPGKIRSGRLIQAVLDKVLNRQVFFFFFTLLLLQTGLFCVWNLNHGFMAQAGVTRWCSQWLSKKNLQQQCRYALSSKPKHPHKWPTIGSHLLRYVLLVLKQFTSHVGNVLTEVSGKWRKEICRKQNICVYVEVVLMELLET